MFLIKRLSIAALALIAVNLVHAQEKHLTLDDIDGLARQKIIDSMKKTPEGGQQGSTAALNTALPSIAPPPVTVATDAVKAPQKRTVSVRRTTPVSFVGAYSDATGSYVLYDYMGAIYPARRGAKLLNGWTVSSVNGYQVSVADGKRNWTEVIVAQAPVITPDSPSVQALNDLAGPLPPVNAPGGSSVFIPSGK